MKVIAVDDERFALLDIRQAIESTLPDCILSCFQTPGEALAYASDNIVDVAFLDIEMGGMNGLTLAKKLKDICGQTNIIFATGYSQYAVDAFAIAASGYILKPVSSKAVTDAMEHLRNPVKMVNKGIFVQTFGNFEVFVDGEPLYFSRSKSKELLAYLIHKRGTSCTIRELSAVLFEEKEENNSLRSQLQTIISTMMKTLEGANAKDIVIKRFNSLAIDPSKVKCDLYSFIQWDADAINSFTGEYMANYSWAEFIVGYLDSKRFNF